MNQPTREQVLKELAAARAAGGVAVLDMLVSRRPSWPWPELLPVHTGVRLLDEASHSLVSCAGMPLGIVPLRDAGGLLCLAMADPWDERMLQKALTALGESAEPLAARGAWLAHHNASTAPLAKTAEHQPLPEGAAEAKPRLQSTSMPESGSDIVNFVNRGLLAAWRRGASDVHFECDRLGLTVKHRLDGVMAFFERINGVGPSEEVISRLKVLAQLDITERRLPQDGRFRFAFEDKEIDLRVSIMPSVVGEDAVLRLLDKSTLRSHEQAVSLDALGFDNALAGRLRRLARLPHGMLLVTGPTGSGKTTTVYAALSEINTGLEKIITIEDPVEYELTGVLQIPVNEKKGLTFARGLRSILRHDPDRILVGEIRDAETAEIAVQSALTGHLVFTTVHANSLFDVIGRFRHFGLDMFGFVSSLNGVVVQRLIRRLCTECSTWREPTTDEISWWRQHRTDNVPQRLPRAIGCDHCHAAGYKGRFVIAEVHVIGDLMRDRILGGAEVTELKRLAFSSDESSGAVAQPLLIQALDCVSAGRTSLEEVFRVVGQV